MGTELSMSHSTASPPASATVAVEQLFALAELETHVKRLGLPTARYSSIDSRILRAPPSSPSEISHEACIPYGSFQYGSPKAPPSASTVATPLRPSSVKKQTITCGDRPLSTPASHARNYSRPTSTTSHPTGKRPRGTSTTSYAATSCASRVSSSATSNSCRSSNASSTVSSTTSSSVSSSVAPTITTPLLQRLSQAARLAVRPSTSHGSAVPMSCSSAITVIRRKPLPPSYRPQTSYSTQQAPQIPMPEFLQSSLSKSTITAASPISLAPPSPTTPTISEKFAFPYSSYSDSMDSSTPASSEDDLGEPKSFWDWSDSDDEDNEEDHDAGGVAGMAVGVRERWRAVARQSVARWHRRRGQSGEERKKYEGCSEKKRPVFESDGEDSGPEKSWPGRVLCGCVKGAAKVMH